MITHTKIQRKFSRRYRFTLAAPVMFSFDSSWPSLASWESGGGVKSWLTLSGREAYIPEGYSWNGCSPRPLGRWGVWWLGTPDFTATINASLLHDALYQHLDMPGFPMDRGQCDRAFLEVMQGHRFPLARVYAGAVQIFGGLHRRITR